MSSKNEFDDDPPTVVDRPPSSKAPVIRAPLLVMSTTFKSRVLRAWITWAPYFESSLGVLSILIFVVTGWLYRFFLKG